MNDGRIKTSVKSFGHMESRINYLETKCHEIKSESSPHKETTITSIVLRTMQKMIVKDHNFMEKKNTRISMCSEVKA